MNKENLKLSIIIPCYNVENFVIYALNSLKNQKNVSYNDFEVLIVNDGSNDATNLIIRKWLQENKELKNFKYYEKENNNWGSVINFIKRNRLLNGLYTTILDADDYFVECALEELFKIIDQGQNYDLILSNFFRNKNSRLYRTWVLFKFKSGPINKKRTHTAWSIPLCKFFLTSKFYSQSNLKEGVSYQDQILYHSFNNEIENIYFIKRYLGVYYIGRKDSSTSQAWNEKRISIWLENMNYLLSLKNQEIASYVLMMLDYCYRKSPRKLKNTIKIKSQYVSFIKKAKFSWLPFGTRNLVKLFYLYFTRKIIKNSY